MFKRSRNLENSFMEPPSSSKRFSLRKRKRDSDAVSVQSLDMSITSEGGKKKGIARVSSLASLLMTPVRPVIRMGHAIQHTLSSSRLPSLPPPDNSQSPSRSPSPTLSLKSTTTTPTTSPSLSRSQRKTNTPYKPPPPTPPTQRPLRLWSNRVAKDDVLDRLSTQEIRRQEAIFELQTCEEDALDDLHLLQRTYAPSLRNLNLLSSQELKAIFGDIPQLMTLHKGLKNELINLRDDYGVTHVIGPALLKWLPGLKGYVNYCGHQIQAKELLDSKKAEDSGFEDFLKRCQESPFSRRMDLWSFLDAPRSRLVKYPLLLRQIAKHTPPGHPDILLLAQVISSVEMVIKEVDTAMGSAACNLALAQMDWSSGDEWIKKASVMHCTGVLKNTRGTKLNCFLFDVGLVLCRPAIKGVPGSCGFQIYRQPIPQTQLTVDDIPDGQIKQGSFRSALTGGQGVKNAFRVSFYNGDGPKYTLIACNEHDKKQWLSCLRTAAATNRAEQNAPMGNIQEEMESDTKENIDVSQQVDTSTKSIKPTTDSTLVQKRPHEKEEPFSKKRKLCSSEDVMASTQVQHRIRMAKSRRKRLSYNNTRSPLTPYRSSGPKTRQWSASWSQLRPQSIPTV